MAHTQSRTAVSVMLERYEMDALIAWHRDEQYRLSDDEKYQEAANHQDRVLQLVDLLDAAKRAPALLPHDASLIRADRDAEDGEVR